MDLKDAVNDVVNKHKGASINPTREELIKQIVRRREAIAAKQGFLSTLTPPESTGRSPRDTLIVLNPKTDSNIDWDSPNNLPIDRETFEMLWDDAVNELKRKKKIFVTERGIGADSSYTMPVRTITNKALTSLFTLNMFRPIPNDIDKSIFSDKEFTLLVLPYDKIDTTRYSARLRQLPNGNTSNMAIIMDFSKRVGLVYGSAYAGSVKKLMFTVMNYYLPFENILPIHCSANEGKEGKLALFLGLSGTGKTSLSADPNRALIGDDEHGWDDKGIANFEYGCYAKLINLNPKKEPEIFNAVFHKEPYLNHGAIVENAMIYLDSTFDLSDERLTPNSRASYPLSFLSNVKESSTGAHPTTIIFLTADANGVLPPVSRLNQEQAMLWFLMGYTSKLAGTETGIIDPESTFSRFFGQPFMSLLPKIYAELLGNKLKNHKASTFLINTGWTGGPYGVGERIDIALTRVIVDAALDGKLDDVEYNEDKLFHLSIPKYCPGVPPVMLTPENTWGDKELYKTRARKLAVEFSQHFDRAYGNKRIAEEVRIQCPGK
ncbi:MAG: phosphoenolpyruvate carboxykinase (ATP) [Proteobacteria bacterium]|nr:phosphoenolpyruvate carboxykinase (ATP) [Pseudomonadota bacterium]